MQRMVRQYAKTGVSSAEDSEYLASMLLAEGVDTPVLVQDVAVMLRQCWRYYQPGGAALSEEERGEVMLALLSWVASTCGRHAKHVKFHKFVAWFREMHHTILRVRTAIDSQPPLRRPSIVAASPIGSPRANSVSSHSLLMRMDSTSSNFDLAAVVAGDRSMYGFEFYETN